MYRLKCATYPKVSFWDVVDVDMVQCKDVSQIQGWVYSSGSGQVGARLRAKVRVNGNVRGR